MPFKALALCCLLGTRISAADPHEPAPGSYAAPAECPGHAAWRAALHARLGERRAKAEIAEKLAVEIERLEGSGPKYSGQVRWADAPGPRDARRVRGATCADVFEALALIALLGLDEVESEAPAVNAGAKAPSSGLLWALPKEDELALARDPPSDPDRGDPPDEALHVAGTAIALWGGAAKPGFGLDLGLALTARWKSTSLEPFVLLGVYGGRERFRVSGTDAAARLERLAAHAVVCPVRFPRDSAAGLRPCMDFDAGVLTGSGRSVREARGHTAPWLSAGLELRAEWLAWDTLELGAMIGGLVAFSRPRFYFLPDTTVFQADTAGIRAGASAGVSF